MAKYEDAPKFLIDELTKRYKESTTPEQRKAVKKYIKHIKKLRVSEAEEWRKSERVIQAAKDAAKREGVILRSIVVEDADGVSSHKQKKARALPPAL